MKSFTLILIVNYYTWTPCIQPLRLIFLKIWIVNFILYIFILLDDGQQKLLNCKEIGFFSVNLKKLSNLHFWNIK